MERATTVTLAQAGASVAMLTRSVQEVDRTVDGLRAAGHHRPDRPVTWLTPVALADALHRLTGRTGGIDILVNAGSDGRSGRPSSDHEQYVLAVVISLVRPLRWIRHVLRGRAQDGCVGSSMRPPTQRILRSRRVAARSACVSVSSVRTASICSCRDGRSPRPVSLPVRVWSSTRSGTR